MQIAEAREEARVGTGTLAFLFTDIAGSTRLWERLPAAMTDALARHDAILNDAIESAGGHGRQDHRRRDDGGLPDARPMPWTRRSRPSSALAKAELGRDRSAPGPDGDQRG